MVRIGCIPAAHDAWKSGETALCNAIAQGGRGGMGQGAAQMRLKSSLGLSALNSNTSSGPGVDGMCCSGGNAHECRHGKAVLGANQTKALPYCAPVPTTSSWLEAPSTPPSTSCPFDGASRDGPFPLTAMLRRSVIASYCNLATYQADSACGMLKQSAAPAQQHQQQQQQQHDSALFSLCPTSPAWSCQSAGGRLSARSPLA